MSYLDLVAVMGRECPMCIKMLQEIRKQGQGSFRKGEWLICAYCGRTWYPDEVKSKSWVRNKWKVEFRKFGEFK